MKKRVFYLSVMLSGIMIIFPASFAHAKGWRQSQTIPPGEGLSSWWYATGEANGAGEDSGWYAGNPLQWQWLDGNQDGIAECYAFNEAGWMFCNTETPDGYQVNEQGAWTVDGQVRTKLLKPEPKAARKSGAGGGMKPVPSGKKAEEPPPVDPQPPERPPEPQPSGSLGFYLIEYQDADSNEVLLALSGQGEPGSKITIPGPDIAQYELCEDQPENFILSDAHQKISIKCRRQSAASSSNVTMQTTPMIHWTIKFVDRNNHMQQLWPAQTGEIRDGGQLQISYPDRITRADGTVWNSVEKAPVTRLVFGPGNMICYVEFEQEKNAGPAGDLQQQEKDRLKQYLEQAKACESLLTGEAAADLWDSRFYVDNQAENDLRVRSIAAGIGDTREHVFYLIGRDFIPNGKAAAEYFPRESVYANLLEAVICIDQTKYYVARMSIQRSFSEQGCTHLWMISRDHAPSCLAAGTREYTCSRCSTKRKVAVPPPGHEDRDGDTVCDRCRRRVIEQQEGSKLNGVLTAGAEKINLTFTCIDEDYQGKMLYLCDTSLPLAVFGGYGNEQYSQSKVRQYFRDGFQNAFSVPVLQGITAPEFAGTDYAVSLSPEEYQRYREKILGTGFYLRSATGIYAVDDQGNIIPAGPREYGVRPGILLDKPKPETPAAVHWNPGDIQARKINGTVYLFRCIDQNYSDGMGNHQRTALFLCETVIPADDQMPCFGHSNDYKYSDVRQWLTAADLFGTEPVNIGVDYAFTGKTGEGQYGDLDAGTIRAHYIGNQKLRDHLFILSVDEAIKYKDYLFKFDGSSADNPEAAPAAGYWLRSPYGSSQNSDTGYVYCVDLIRGNIHPQAIRPEQNEEQQMNEISPIGVRPAFVMPQN